MLEIEGVNLSFFWFELSLGAALRAFGTPEELDFLFQQDRNAKRPVRRDQVQLADRAWLQFCAQP